MKPGIPWSVKGIEPDVREAAKQAARRSGMTLGEWLNSTILDSAEGTTADPLARDFGADDSAARAVPPRSMHALERTATRLEDIAEQLARLSRRDAETAARFAPAPEQRGPDQETLNRILTRVDSNERQTVEAFTAVNDRLSVLGRQIAQAGKTRDARPEDSPGFQALEKAVRNIVEHMEASEKRNRDNFKTLHERLSSMSQRAAIAPQDQVSRAAPALSQLENRLSELARRVESSESSRSHSALPDLLKSELTELANRIDTVRDTAESLAKRAQTQAVQTSQQELRAIEQRIVGLVKEAQQSLVGQVPAPADMQRLRGEIERLNARIDDAQRAQASGGDVMALRAAVEQLSTRVAQGPDMRPLAEMDRRILDITQRLEQTQAQTRNLPQVNELERRIAELDNRLSEAEHGRGAPAAGELEERLSDIAQRVERTEQQLSSLETIERAVNQLFDAIEKQRGWTEQVAESAANRMAQHMLSQQPAMPQLSAAPEIQALQDGLQAVRSAAEQADNRNQETLVAVHDTLEQIVTKLAELETAAIGQRVAAVAAPVAEAAAAPAAAVSTGWQVAESLSPQPEEQPVNNPFDAAPASLAAEEPQPALSSAPAQEEITLNNPFAPAADSSTPDTAGPAADDFIAAARRAAQASVQPKSLLGGLAPGAGKPGKDKAPKDKSQKRGFLSFSSRRKDNAAKPAAAPLSATPVPGKAEQPENKRRKLLLMGLVLLAAVSAFTFNLMGQAQKAANPVAPVTITPPVEQPQSSLAPQDFAPAAPSAPAAAPASPAAQSQSMLDGGLQETDPLLTGSLPSSMAETPSVADVVQGTQPAPQASLPPKEIGTMALREAAANGNGDAQFVIATRYLNGESGVKQDYAKAAYWYGKAAAQGLAPAQYRLGTLYERGLGVAKDLDAALGWYERAAGLGNIRAMHNAAVLSAGSDSRAPDYKRAYKWFSLGAAHGLKDSQFNLAVLLERGLGTKANPAEALFWYSVAGQQNDADANRRADTLAKSLSAADLQAVHARLKSWKPDVAPDTANTIAVTNTKWQASGG